MLEASKVFCTPAKIDDESLAALEAKNDKETRRLGLEDDQGVPLASFRARVQRISGDLKGNQEPFLSGLDEENKLEPDGADWEHSLSENSSVDWNQGPARETTTFPQLSSLLKKPKRSTRDKGTRPSGRDLFEMVG